MTVNDEEEPEIQSLAEEIARYLQGREQVADTLDGILQWWILRQLLQEECRRVERAMAYLHQQGKIRKIPARRTPVVC